MVCSVVAWLLAQPGVPLVSQEPGRGIAARLYPPIQPMELETPLSELL